MKLLDCTLRDGGYYTNWDFDDTVVDSYIQAMNALPIDYLELGYRNMPSKEYLGKSLDILLYLCLKRFVSNVRRSWM